jgi:antitoxin HicB
MTDMAQHARQTLDEYLAREYPFHVIASRDGGYVIVYPDLPGCITQADTIEEIPDLAEEARRLWIEAEYEDGHDVPLPSYPEEYSGKFVARLPRSLHRQLAEEAERQGVSLNQHVVALLSRGDAQARVERHLAELEARLSSRLDLISRGTASSQPRPKARAG